MAWQTIGNFVNVVGWIIDSSDAADSKYDSPVNIALKQKPDG
jgi:hypothetical protein